MFSETNLQSPVPDVEDNEAYPHALRGYTLYKQRRYVEALAEYQKAVRLAPNSGQVYGNLGFTCNKLEDYDAAISYFEKAIELMPASAKAYHGLGVAYAGKYDIDGVQQAWEEVLRLEPRYSPCCVRRGLALIYLGKRQWKRAFRIWLG